jgi:hypothetical protein
MQETSRSNPAVNSSAKELISSSDHSGTYCSPFGVTTGAKKVPGGQYFLAGKLSNPFRVQLHDPIQIVKRRLVGLELILVLVCVPSKNDEISKTRDESLTINYNRILLV